MYVPTFQGLGAGDFVRPVMTEPSPYPFDARQQFRFYRARNAIYHLFRALQPGTTRLTVLAPDYNSGNEVLAMHAAGVTIQYYPVGADGQADPAVVEACCARYQPDVLYVIHYLGWPQPMWELAALCRRRGLVLVEDCALALLSTLGGRPLGSFGDWAIYCLYKTLPVPNGAILVQNVEHANGFATGPLRRASLASDAGRTAELLLQRTRGRVNRIGAALEFVKRSAGRAAGALDVDRATVGDIGFSLADVDLAISPVSTHVLQRLDFAEIHRTRVRNFTRLAALLEGCASLLRAELADGVCPLFLPLLVPDKPAAAAALRRRGVQALEFWNEGAGTGDAVVSPATTFLRAHVLGLPVHQDLSLAQIAHVARQVTDLRLSMPS